MFIAIVGHPADGFKLRPVDIRVGVACRRVQGRELNGEILADVLTGGGGDERRGEQRRRRAGVGCSIRRIRAADTDRQRFDRGVKHAVAGPDAGFGGPDLAASASRPDRCAARNPDFREERWCAELRDRWETKFRREHPGKRPTDWPGAKVASWLYFSYQGSMRSQRRP